jgi:hypothetical protein
MNTGKKNIEGRKRERESVRERIQAERTGKMRKNKGNAYQVMKGVALARTFTATSLLTM